MMCYCRLTNIVVTAPEGRWGTESKVEKPPYVVPSAPTVLTPAVQAEGPPPLADRRASEAIGERWGHGAGPRDRWGPAGVRLLSLAAGKVQ